MKNIYILICFLSMISVCFSQENHEHKEHLHHKHEQASDTSLNANGIIYLETNTNKPIYGSINKLFKKKGYKYFSNAKSLHCTSILEPTEQVGFLTYKPQLHYFGYDTLTVKLCHTKEKLDCDSFIVVVTIQRQSMMVNSTITDASTGKFLPCFAVLNGDTLIRFRKFESKVPFEFSCELKPFKKNKLEFLQIGYMPATLMFDLTDSLNSFFLMKEVELYPLIKGSAIALQNILFENGKSVLKSESYAELDKLVSMLITNQTLKIYVGGHTDNKGDEKLNLKLSEERAIAVVKYLNEKGIDANRLFSKGFGSQKPITTNDTEEGRNKNRRVEFTITDK